MKANFTQISFIIVLLFTANSIWAQQQYTIYDELPGLDKSIKPAYDINYPNWAKMLYQHPINIEELDKEYEAYMDAHEGEKNPVIRYYKIWRKMIDPYVLKDGNIELSGIQEKKKMLLDYQLKAKNELPSVLKSTGANWTFLGPKNTYWLNSDNSPVAPLAFPWQVNVYSFDVSDSDNNIIFCGTESGILNKSIDEGISWEQKGKDYVFGGAINAVAIHPEKPDTIYLSSGSNIHKSTDGGNNWTPMLGITKQFGANRVKIDVNQPDKLIASSSKGVHISEDAGVSWSNPLTYESWDIEFKPDDSNIIYSISQLDGKFRIFSSEDAGVSFSEITSFPKATTHSGAMLAVTPDNPNALYAILLTSDSDYSPYLYKGVLDAGNWTWVKLATGKTSEFGMDNGQGYFDLVLEVSPNDENLIFVGTTTLFKSSDGGANFIAIGGYYGSFRIHPDIQDMQILPGGKTWVATDGGMTISMDYFTGLDQFSCRTNGIVGSEFWGFDQGWNEDIIVGGRYHNGNTAMADFYGDKALRMGGAESATGWVIQGKSRHVAFSDLDKPSLLGGRILPATAEGTVGKFKFSKYPNMPSYGGYRGNILHHPNYYNMIFVGGGDTGETILWKSEDMGANFDMIYDFPDKVLYMEISFSDPDIMYADIVNHGLFRSEDGGQTWEHKPTLTDWTYGGSLWEGKTFIAVSPSNGNVIYVGLTNTPRTHNVGKIFKSIDGGDTWSDISGSLAGYLESIVIQPDEYGNDLLYAFMNSAQVTDAKCYFKRVSMPDWMDYSSGLPAAISFNRAMPFYRDSKLRGGGTASVWESPMAVPDFKPLINFWVGNSNYTCLDTIVFDDHSVLNHSGASWEWAISPDPDYISDPHVRNPKVVLGLQGDYSVTLRVTKDGEVYEKTIDNFISSPDCPSIHNCDNPAELSKAEWELVFVDSEEMDLLDRNATFAFDKNNNTYWITEWYNSDPPPPHFIHIGLDSTYLVQDFIYVPRQDASLGRIADYELFFKEDGAIWEMVSSGTFPDSNEPQIIHFDEQIATQNVKLIALSEVNGNSQTAVAEISLVGCYDCSSSTDNINALPENLPAFPVPASNIIHIPLPKSSAYTYNVYSMNGRLIEQGTAEQGSDSYSINLSAYSAGIYFVKLTDESGINYRAKFIKR